MTEPKVQRNPGTLRTYLARHGETESNRSRRYAGRNKDRLTPEGRQQILNLARVLGGENIASIWTSPIVRAVESAGLISQELWIPLEEDPRLAEMLMGPWEGLTETEVERTYPLEYDLWNTAPHCLDMKGRETLSRLVLRVMAVVEDASRRSHPVLLMTHVAPIRVATLSVLGLDLNLYKRLVVPNAGCLVVDRARADAYRMPGLTAIRDELNRAEIRDPC